METEKAKKIISEMFNLLGLGAEEVNYRLDEKRGHVFSVKSASFDAVAEKNKDLARDLVYVFKRIFNKSAKPGEEIFKCTIDINDLQSKADAHVRTKALNAAEEARNLKTDVLLEPMSSYDRMVVHSTLAGQTDITTESAGEGRERRVKIKYLSI
jgi:predicted RNA-binding protein Jag